jgi:hypothetical protein
MTPPPKPLPQEGGGSLAHQNKIYSKKYANDSKGWNENVRILELYIKII